MLQEQHQQLLQPPGPTVTPRSRSGGWNTSVQQSWWALLWPEAPGVSCPGVAAEGRNKTPSEILQLFMLEKCHGWSWEIAVFTVQRHSFHPGSGWKCIPQASLPWGDCETSFLSCPLSPSVFHKFSSARASSTFTGVPRFSHRTSGHHQPLSPHLPLPVVPPDVQDLTLPSDWLLGEPGSSSVRGDYRGKGRLESTACKTAK